MITTDVIDSFTGEYRFLSNFYECNMMYVRQEVPSVEHAYVMAKLGITKAEQIQELAKLTPGQIKRHGRQYKMIDNWDNMKLAMMSQFVGVKFSMNPDLAQKLLETGDALLVEGNTWGDTYWGQDQNGNGKNHLGKILMRTRDLLVLRINSNIA